MPCRPLVIAQLDSFVGIDRCLPIAPLWATEVRGSKNSPHKFFRTAHWVREQVKLILSPQMAAQLPPDKIPVWSSIVDTITALIVCPFVVIVEFYAECSQAILPTVATLQKYSNGYATSSPPALPSAAFTSRTVSFGKFGCSEDGG